jgi:hypothetical protein
MEKVISISPADIYRKVMTGEPVSDEEIAVGIEHFGRLAEMLRESGVAFSITAAECNRVVEMLKGFMWMRKME